jgi:hypothetical protein
MRKIIKKFGQYVKENINQDKNSNFEDDDFPIEGTDLDAIEEMESEDLKDVDDLDSEDFDEDFDDEDFDEDIDDREYEEEEVQEEEEEAYQYIGTQLMSELASKLGVEVSNNEINYEGKKINYFSETECFHINGNKFDSIEEVIEYLQSGANEE